MTLVTLSVCTVFLAVLTFCFAAWRRRRAEYRPSRSWWVVLLCAGAAAALALSWLVIEEGKQPRCVPIATWMPTGAPGVLVETYFVGGVGGYDRHVSLHEDGRVVARDRRAVRLSEVRSSPAADSLRALAGTVKPFKWPDPPCVYDPPLSSDELAEGFYVFGRGSRDASLEEKKAMARLAAELEADVRRRIRELHPGDPW